MDVRKIVLLVGALLIAAVTAFMARSLILGSGAPAATALGAPPPQVNGPEVLVATRALPIGTILGRRPMTPASSKRRELMILTGTQR